MSRYFSFFTILGRVGVVMSDSLKIMERDQNVFIELAIVINTFMLLSYTGNMSVM